MVDNRTKGIERNSKKMFLGKWKLSIKRLIPWRKTRINAYLGHRTARRVIVQFLGLLELMELCCSHLQTDLRIELEARLGGLISAERIFRIYSLASKHDIDSLKKKCHDL